MRFYRGVFIKDGTVRHLTFEAETLEEAQKIAADWGVGVDGEAAELEAQQAVILPVLLDLKTAQRLCGNISRGTVYNWIATGKLERDPDSRKVLITRRSVERVGKN